MGAHFEWSNDFISDFTLSALRLFSLLKTVLAWEVWRKQSRRIHRAVGHDTGLPGALLPACCSSAAWHCAQANKTCWAAELVSIRAARPLWFLISSHLISFPCQDPTSFCPICWAVCRVLMFQNIRVLMGSDVFQNRADHAKWSRSRSRYRYKRCTKSWVFLF